MKRNEGIHWYDISSEAWERVKKLLPGQAGKRGGAAKDKRLFINAVAWQTRTGAPWRDRPSEFGNWTGYIFRALKRLRGITTQSSPLPSSPPFMSGVCSSTSQSTLPRGN